LRTIGYLVDLDCILFNALVDVLLHEKGLASIGRKN